MVRSMAKRLDHDLLALVAAATGPLSLDACTAALESLGHIAQEVEARLRELVEARRVSLTAKSIDLDVNERRRRYGKLSEARRSFAHRLLAQHADLPEQRAWHALEAGDPARALTVAEQLKSPCARADLEIALRKALLAGQGRQRLRPDAAKRMRFALARAYYASDQVDAAKQELETLGARRSRSAELRLAWARVLHRQGKYAESLRVSSALCAQGPPEEVAAVTLDLHARNLLQLGRGRHAVDVLTTRLSRPGPTSKTEELRLHLTLDRCARESKVEAGAKQRTLDLARVVREARSRRDDDLVASAAFRVGVALSDTEEHDRALRWLGRALLAQLARGDEYRAAEIENSIAILEHKLGRVDAAKRTFESAAARLARLGEKRPLAIVGLNYADLMIDLLDGVAAREAILYAIAELEEGVLRFKAELMLLDTALEHGAAPDAILSRLDEVEATSQYERPAVLAYADTLRARALAGLDRRREATAITERAAERYLSVGRSLSAASTLAMAAAWQTEVGDARRLVARALWSSRRNPPLLVDFARNVLAGRTGPARSRARTALPLLRRRASEVDASLARLLAGQTATTSVDDAAHLALARLFATTMPRHAIEAGAFCEEHLGARRWIVLQRGPVGSQVVLAARDLDVEAALYPTRAIASHLTVHGRHHSLVLQDPDVEHRFGARQSRLAHDFVELLDAREDAVGMSVEATLPSETAVVNTRACPSRPSGQSSAIRALRREVRALAPSLLPLTILGEPGSGKDRLARYVHECSNRAGGPLVVVDCAAFPEQLAEAELVGHVRGAYTGADTSRRGLLERASGGSVVLDHVERLPLRAQALLLRVIESGGLRPLGTTDEVKVDLRILTIAVDPLEAFVERGELRADLAWRLGGATLRMPALRERRDDLSTLLRELILEENGRRSRPVRPDVVLALRDEAWPGNVVELRNRVRRAILLTPEADALGEHLLGAARPEHAGADSQASAPAATLARHTVVQGLRLHDQLRLFERSLIAEALDSNGGHREASARQLGITRRWLHKRLRDLGLQ